ncbi:MAG: hypothetical protein QM680_06225 [Luteolibacter sp.]
MSSLLPHPGAPGTLAGHPSASRKALRPLKIAAIRERHFPLVSLANHGGSVKKGQLLWQTDTTALDRRIRAQQIKIKRQQKRLNQEENSWRLWLSDAIPNLETLQKLADSKQNEAEYFRNVVSASRRDISRNAIRRANQILCRQAHEYRALFSLEKNRHTNTHLAHRMLEWHQGIIAAAEFSVGMEMLNHRKLMDRQLPHELGLLVDAAENARRHYAAALVAYTRRMEMRTTLHNRALERFTQECRKLAELEMDRSLCTLHAPANGCFFHAEVLSASPDSLPTGQVIAYFLPEDLS